MKKRKILSWIFVILWMMVIFFFSAQNGGESSELSTGVLMKIQEITHVPVANDIFKFVIRKSAHFTEYAILGVLVINLFHQYKKITLKNLNYIMLFSSIVICFFYAMTDEFHQLFVAGRSGQFIDVCIDTCGSIVGIVFYILLKNFLKKNTLRNNS